MKLTSFGNEVNLVGDSGWETKRPRSVLIGKAHGFIVSMNHFGWPFSWI